MTVLEFRYPHKPSLGDLAGYAHVQASNHVVLCSESWRHVLCVYILRSFLRDKFCLPILFLLVSLLVFISLYFSFLLLSSFTPVSKNQSSLFPPTFLLPFFNKILSIWSLSHEGVSLFYPLWGFFLSFL